jgi:outer membrane protein assembly factor BamB/Icc-related predicted phosphoesterase
MHMRYQVRLKSVFFIFLFLVIGGSILNGQKPVTFAFLTDLHVNPLSASDTNLINLVNEINRTNVDFIIVTGDLTNTGSDAELTAVKKALDKLSSPCYVLPGNHETNWAESAGLTVNKFWGDDRFFFNLNGYSFVGFSTGPYMKMGDGHVKQEDLKWLKNKLLQQNREDKVLISFSHYPLAEGLDDWPQVTEILKTFNCRIDFCGHGHKLALLNFDGIPGIMGRSVLLGNSRVPGYNLVTLRNDSMLIYNKELSVAVKKPAIVINYLKPDAIEKITISQRPDYSVNNAYSNRKVTAEWSDTSSIFSGPCLVNDTVLVYGNSLGYVKALNTRSLKMLWQIQIQGPVYSTPVASEGVVALGTVDGSVLGLDARNGNQLWSVKTGRPVLAEGIAEGKNFYIGGGDRSFYKIDIKTGNIIWQFSGLDGLIQGKPALSDSSFIFGAWDQHLYCLDKQTGSLKWKWNNGKPQKLYSPGNIFPVCAGGRVFIVAPDRFMTAIDFNTGKQIWRTGMHQVRESMGVSPDGLSLYAKLMNDTVISVSTSTDFPNTKWAINAGFGYEHNPCPILATSDLVIAATRSGMVIAIDPEKCRIVWKYKAGNSSVNKVVADKQQTFWFTLMEGKIVGLK